MFRLKTFCSVLLLLGLVVARIPAQETQQLFLSGHGKDDAVPWKFLCTTGALSGFWTNIPVPSNWEMHGFGHLTYKKDYTNAWTERGLYEHDFTIPAEWTNKRVFLVFEGAMTDTYAKLNGKSVGATNQGGFYRFKYEVTSLVKFGTTNRLEVEVAKHSANKSVNNAERLADYWVFGGIYRPVHLDAVPLQFIERVAVDARHDGNFSMDVIVNGATDADSVEAQIQTLAGKSVGKPFGVPALSGPNHLKAGLRTKIPSPLQWTTETPNLYQVEVRLKRGGEILHRITQRFGFRTMEVRDGDGLYVNGQRVILKGVGRHSFWPDSGRCLSEAVHRLDIETMKDANMNAVRVVHYPPDAEFLDLCDELGLYVVDELAGWHKFYDDKIGSKLAEAMVVRDVNHPSVLFWDNGNEGGFNTNLDNIFPQFDPQQRRVLHPWASFSGLCTAHYLAYDKAEIATSGKSVYFQAPDKEVVATNDHAKYIYMPTEFLHGLFDGGGGAGLADYWKVMTASNLSGGGFIWGFTDEGVKRPDTGKIDTVSNQAPDGIVGPYREREGSFYTVKEIWSPIQVVRKTTNTFSVQNHYSFTDASQCKFTWQLRRFYRPEQTNSGFIVVREGKVELPPISPLGQGLFELNLPHTDERVDALALRVDDPKGRELWTWVWPMSGVNLFGNQPTNRAASGQIVATKTNRVLAVTAGDFNFNFSRDTGLLMGVKRGAQIFSLTNGPRPALGKKVRLTKLKWRQDGDKLVITAKYFGELKSVIWRVHNDGWLQCEYKYEAHGTQDFFGVTFDYPEDFVQGKRWLGNGPYRVWKNRLNGTTLNVWSNSYNNTITGWRDWIYPEFKGCFAGVNWLQLQTTEGQITVVPENIPFLQLLTPEQPPDEFVRKTKVNLPKCGLGFLDAVPPIGSSTKEANALGPQSQPNISTGIYSGSVSFFFGGSP